jgi:D-arabinose 1-dehydrogenase-like Zn-dependent alcohol dehydrogenase
MAAIPNLPKTYLAAVLESKGAPFALKDLPLKLPGPGQVLVKVIATGVCHSDSMVQDGSMGNSYPRVPGHETIGEVVAIPQGENKWKLGDRVGGPWHGGSFLILCFWKYI